eukprot:11813574-Heterocapsa_arctica.AAC.1
MEKGKLKLNEQEENIRKLDTANRSEKLKTSNTKEKAINKNKEIKKQPAKAKETNDGGNVEASTLEQ